MARREGIQPLPIWQFFAGSEFLDHMSLRPLSHIRCNWELRWDSHTNAWSDEDGSFAKDLNEVIDELSRIQAPRRYHENEDRLAEYVKAHLKWGIRKEGSRWVEANYDLIIEQGGFGDIDQQDLMAAVAGRIAAARSLGQHHFDEMERSHQRMLAAVLAVLLFHRTK